MSGRLGFVRDGLRTEFRSLKENDLVEALVDGRADAGDAAVEGLGELGEPMLSATASAILIDLLRSSSLKEVSLESSPSGGSSVNPATYISIASSTVIPSSDFDIGRERGSRVGSVMMVSLVTTLLRFVAVVAARLDVVVRAERKLFLASVGLEDACQGRWGLGGRSYRSGPDLRMPACGEELPRGRAKLVKGGERGLPPAVTGLET